MTTYDERDQARAELKPCPFCGSPAAVETRTVVYHGVTIQCRGCSAQMYGGDVTYLSTDWEGEWTVEAAEDDVVKKWNQRTALARVAELEALNAQAERDLKAAIDALLANGVEVSDQWRGLSNWVKQQARIAELEAERELYEGMKEGAAERVAELEEEVAELEAEVRRLRDEAYELYTKGKLP